MSYKLKDRWGARQQEEELRRLSWRIFKGVQRHGCVLQGSNMNVNVQKRYKMKPGKDRNPVEYAAAIVCFFN